MSTRACASARFEPSASYTNDEAPTSTPKVSYPRIRRAPQVGAPGAGLHAAFATPGQALRDPQSHVAPLLVTAQSATVVAGSPRDGAYNGRAARDAARHRPRSAAGDPTAPRSTSVMARPGSRRRPRATAACAGQSLAPRTNRRRPSRRDPPRVRQARRRRRCRRRHQGSPRGHRTLPRRLPSGARARNAPAGEMPCAVQSNPGGPPPPLSRPMPGPPQGLLLPFLALLALLAPRVRPVPRGHCLRHLAIELGRGGSRGGAPRLRHVRPRDAGPRRVPAGLDSESSRGWSATGPG